MHRTISVLLISLDLLALQAEAQDSRIIPGPPPDEYVDVTGDGIADLLITNRTIHISDPEQPGYLGKHLLGVRTLSGNAVLLWNTSSTQRWYTLEDSTRLDTGLLAKRIHFKQLNWTDEDHPTEFWLLERPFGPAITQDQDGWYGTGDHHEGLTLVLRSANHRGTSVAAFEFELPYPYGRVVVRTKYVVRVPNGYGEEGELIVLKREPQEPPFDFGHEPVEPQVIIPPGLPPDEAIDLTSDDVPDVIITGYEQPGEGFFTRGVSPAPGAAFLMRLAAWGGSWELFRLGPEEVLTPDQLTSGLRSNVLMWATPEQANVFCPVLHHRNHPGERSPSWEPFYEEPKGNPVFRTLEYGRPVIGVVALQWSVPGGELSVDAQNWVEEGQVLQVR
ncbi:MAG: hypothetical protein ACO1NQ_04415 [Flavobacteriales bacterium]